MLDSGYLLSDSVAIFISHAQADTVWRDEVEKHLKPLLHLRSIMISSSREIMPGSLPTSTIENSINAAQIILLLISPNFMASDQCCKVEMELALERQLDGAKVIPIKLTRIINWEKLPFAKLQALPKGGKFITTSSNQDEALFEVADGIRTVVEALLNRQKQQWPVGYRSIIRRPSSHQVVGVQRVDHVREIYERLTKPDVGALALFGIEGIGKSTLAALVYEYAEQERNASCGPWTGKTLWLNIDGNVTLIDIVGTLRECLDQPRLNFARMKTADVVYEFSRTLQAIEQPCLIILDQFEALLDSQTGQARMKHAGIDEWLDELKAQVYPSRILLTSRFSQHGTRSSPAHSLQKYHVPPFALEEAGALLRLWGIKASAAEIRLAVEKCSGHPLVLALLCGLLIDDPGVSITDFFERPNYVQQRIDAEKFLTDMFTRELNQDQRDLLGAFAIYREAVPVEAAQKVVAAFAIPVERLPSAHRILLTQQLLFSRGERRYQSHSIVAEFARQYISKQHEQSGQGQEVLRSAHIQAAKYYQEQAKQDTHQREPRRGLESVHALIEAVWHLCQAKRQQEAYDLIGQENLFFDLRRWGSNSVLLELYQSLELAKTWKPPLATAARIYNEIGEIHQVMGTFAQAEHYFKRALESFRTLDEPDHIVNALNNLGTMYRQQGHILDALACYQEAKELSDNSQAKIAGIGTTFNNLGYAYIALARQERQRKDANKEHAYYQQALASYQQALPLHESDENWIEKARTLNNMGEIYQALGQRSMAYDYHGQALTLAQKQQDLWIEAMALNNLGVLAKRWPTPQISALACYRQALAIFRAISARASESTVLKNLGYWYLAQEQYEAALACFVLAQNLNKETRHVSEEEIPRTVISELHLALGEQGVQMLQHDVATRAEEIVEQALQE